MQGLEAGKGLSIQLEKGLRRGREQVDKTGKGKRQTMQASEEVNLLLETRFFMVYKWSCIIIRSVFLRNDSGDFPGGPVA